MADFINGITIEIAIIFGINILLIFVLFMMCISNRLKLKRLKVKYNKFMSGFGDSNIEELLEKCINNVESVSEKNREIENHLNKIDRNLYQCIQKVGVVRFNAYDNVGSDLSFAIALLDNNDDGIVLSGLFSRDSSLNYAKPVQGGKSKYALSAEELQAIDIARKTYREQLYYEK